MSPFHSFTKGQKVKGSYYGREFTGTIDNVVCVNNGPKAAWSHHIILDNPITDSFGTINSIAWNDRDQTQLGYSMEIVPGC